ncbi:site-specific integrase [Acidisoma sp. 7E03]
MSVRRRVGVAPARGGQATPSDRPLSPATARAYQEDWNRFVRWCAETGATELPAEAATICRFLEMARADGRHPATVNRQMAAIGYMHREAGFLTPLLLPEGQTIRRAMARLTEPSPARPQRPTMRLWGEILGAMGHEDLADVRDRALIALHVAGAFRCAELSRLASRQVHVERGSMQIHLGRFRSNAARGVPQITLMDDPFLLPVTQMRCWLETSEPQGSAVFRHCAAGCVTDRAMSEEEVRAVILDRGRAAGLHLTPPR